MDGVEHSTIKMPISDKQHVDDEIPKNSFLPDKIGSRIGKERMIDRHHKEI